MAETNTRFITNAYRYDPYKNFKFRVRFNGKVVAGISKVSVLKVSTEAVMHREGGEPNMSRVTPSVMKFDPITLERGVTHDREFEDWAKLVWKFDGTGIDAMSLENFRKEITIELLNEQGVVAIAYNVFRCWVSEYQALPELDANAHVVAIEKIVLQNEGWENANAPEPKQS